MTSFYKLFDLETVKVADFRKANKTLITVSLFSILNEYKPLSLYNTGLAQLVKAIKDSDDLVLRIYYDELTVDQFEMLSQISNVELMKFTPYDLADTTTGSLGVFGALLRYLPLFIAEKHYPYAIVLDLDINLSVLNEFLGYIDEMKKFDFVYSCRKWYRSGRYWYDNMAHNSFYHMVRGWGVGFRTGLLSSDLLLNFIYECSLNLNTIDPILYQFKTLSYEGTAEDTYSPEKTLSCLSNSTFPYGTVELFMTFYVFPAMLKSKHTLMRIDVQYGILNCLAQDLLEHVPTKLRNAWFLNECNMTFSTFVKCMQGAFVDEKKELQALWDKFLILVARRIGSGELFVDYGLWNFIQAQNSTVLHKNNNKTVLTDYSKKYLYERIFGSA